MSAQPQNRPNPAPIEAQTTQAWEMASNGSTVREIAKELGIAVSTAHARLRAAIESIPPMERAEQRAVSHARHEWMWQQAREQIEMGRDPMEVIPEMRQLEKERRRLLGLDEPVRLDATVTETTQADLELAEMVREAQAADAATYEQLQRGGLDHERP